MRAIGGAVAEDVKNQQADEVVQDLEADDDADKVLGGAMDDDQDGDPLIP
jgi:hypothetical protein